MYFEFMHNFRTQTTLFQVITFILLYHHTHDLSWVGFLKQEVYRYNKKKDIKENDEMIDRVYFLRQEVNKYNKKKNL